MAELVRCDAGGRPLPPGPSRQRCGDQGASAGHLGPVRPPRPVHRPEWANRRRLLRARECLSDKGFAKMIGGGV